MSVTISPHQFERQGVPGHGPSPICDYAMDSTCVYQHTTQLLLNNAYI